MESQRSWSHIGRAEPWIAMAFCAAVIVGWSMEHLVRDWPAYVGTVNPGWLPPAAAGLAIAGIIVRQNGRPQSRHLLRALIWSGLLLMVWVSNGLPLDMLRLTPLMPLGVDWPSLTTKILALSAAVLLARLVLTRPDTPTPTRPAIWYGYAAFVLALPYPVLRTIWALGGTLGLRWSGAAGQGFEPWLACTPWLLAAILSILLVPTWHWMPRRLLLAAGWSATAIVALIGPAACWSLITKLPVDGDLDLVGIAVWVPCLFYGSWLLWAIAAGAATRSYQLRSASLWNARADKTISFGGKMI